MLSRSINVDLCYFITARFQRLEDATPTLKCYIGVGVPIGGIPRSELRLEQIKVAGDRY